MKYKPYPPFFQFLSVVPNGDKFHIRKAAPSTIKGSFAGFDCLFVPEGYFPFLSIEAFKVTRGDAAMALYALEGNEELLVETGFLRNYSGGTQDMFTKVEVGKFVKMLNAWESWRHSFSDADVPVCPPNISEEVFNTACLYSYDVDNFWQKKTYREVVTQLASGDAKAFFDKPMTGSMLLEIEGVDGEDGKDHRLTLSSPFSEFYGVASARTQELADLNGLSWKLFKEEHHEAKTNAADSTGGTKPRKRRAKPMQRTEPSNDPAGG